MICTYSSNCNFTYRLAIQRLQGVVHLQNQNYLVTESLSVVKKLLNCHTNPNDSHNYHDKNHDEIELYQGNSNRST